MDDHPQIRERDALLRRIAGHLEAEQGVDPTTISHDTRFRDDLGIDSLDLAGMALALESEYGIRLDDEAILRIETVGDACDLILSERASDAAPAG